jgi:hypothetical protein
MGILDDIKRLGLELDEENKKDLEALFDRAKAEKGDELVTKTKIEYYIGEYLTEMRPDIMSVLEKEKQTQNSIFIQELTKRFDDKGKRICDEVGCSSVEGVDQCQYCERFVCKQHNFSSQGHCCYACHLEYIEKK